LGDEVWIVERDRLTHSVGIWSWNYTRQFEHAELEIVMDFSTNFSVPYYRLYAVVHGKPQFLIERRQSDLQLLAAFIAFHTGWRMRPASVMPFRSVVPGGRK
jgi:hypothetical protein